MKVLYVVKVGTTFPNTARRLGDFDKWTVSSLDATRVPTAVVDAEHGAELPAAGNCAGVVITGSHAMVTDELPWSVAVERWISKLLDAGVPIFGICYGHQLLAKAAGGEVDFHPKGQEIGTVPIETRPGAAEDPLFSGLPASFLAHTTHSQSVLRLPDRAVHLAGNAFEPNHAFRLGSSAWGVQFHPEYDGEVMRAYIDEQSGRLAERGVRVDALRAGVTETPEALETIRGFARYVDEREGARL